MLHVSFIVENLAIATLPSVHNAAGPVCSGARPSHCGRAPRLGFGKWGRKEWLHSPLIGF